MNQSLLEEDFILSVGAGKNQLPLIKAIKDCGYKVISCDNNPDAEGKYVSDIFLNVSSYEPKKIISELRLLNLIPCAVLTRSTGIPIVTVAVIASVYGLAGIDVEIAELLIQKNKFIRKTNELEIPSPKLFLERQLPNITLPVFVKPAFTVVSHAAMSVCYNSDELVQAINQAKSVSVDRSVNIEEYLIGTDIVSIDFVHEEVVQHLVSIGEISTGSPNFDGVGWFTIDDNLNQIAYSSFLALQQALGITHGFFQTAMKYCEVENTAKIYEVHAEIGGDLVNDVFIPFITGGYNVFKNNISLSLNQRPECFTKPIKAAILLFRKKMSQYNIALPVQRDVKKHHYQNYVIIEFGNQTSLNQYLTQLTQQINISITNREF